LLVEEQVVQRPAVRGTLSPGDAQLARDEQPSSGCPRLLSFAGKEAGILRQELLEDRFGLVRGFGQGFESPGLIYQEDVAHVRDSIRRPFR
jgi:hypothetical protein